MALTQKQVVEAIRELAGVGVTTATPERKEAPKIVREGNQIVLPTDMTYAEGREWLSKQEQSEEKLVAIADFIPCFPLDGVVALGIAMQEIFGFTNLADRDGFWGPVPPVLVQVATPKGIKTAALGKMQPPPWEEGHLIANVRAEAQLQISGQVKRKFEPQVKQVLERVRTILKEQSIYKGQAVMLNLEWMEGEREFHPVNDAPQFMDLTGSGSLVLNKRTEFELATSVFMLIERQNECVANGISLKHGVMLSGGYGTGKTLTAKIVAEKATRHGWTFLYLRRAVDLAQGLRVAQLYSPAVVFVEDVDSVVEGERDTQLNDLLNTLDGVDTKSHPIITILTTNHPEKIQPAFIRAGRIDTVIRFEPPDAEACLKFIRIFTTDDEGRKLLKEGENLDNTVKAMEGMVPAFICEAVAKAKRFAIYREGNDIVDKMLADDITLAAESIQSHMKMAAQKNEPTEREKLAHGLAGWLESNATDYQ